MKADPYYILKAFFHLFLLLVKFSGTKHSMDTDMFQNGEDVCVFHYSGNLADCSNRSLTQIPVEIPSDIQYLDLSFNNIKVLHSNTFKKLTKLRVLKLNNNQINTIHPSAFNNLENLEVLDLSFNKIKVLNNDVFYGLKNLEHLYMRNNNFICNCDTYWLFSWLQQQTNVFKMLHTSDLYKITCHNMSSSKESPLLLIGHAAFSHCFHDPMRKDRHRRESGSLSHWTCGEKNGEKKVVPLENVADTTASLHTCMLACAASSKVYGLLKDAACLCGNAKSSTYNAGSNCKIRCSLQPATCLPYINSSEVYIVSEYLLTNDTETSAMQTTMINTTRETMTGSQITSALITSTIPSSSQFSFPSDTNRIIDSARSSEFDSFSSLFSKKDSYQIDSHESGTIHQSSKLSSSKMIHTLQIQETSENMALLPTVKGNSKLDSSKSTSIHQSSMLSISRKSHTPQVQETSKGQALLSTTKGSSQQLDTSKLKNIHPSSTLSLSRKSHTPQVQETSKGQALLSTTKGSSQQLDTSKLKNIHPSSTLSLSRKDHTSQIRETSRESSRQFDILKYTDIHKSSILSSSSKDSHTSQIKETLKSQALLSAVEESSYQFHTSKSTTKRSSSTQSKVQFSYTSLVAPSKSIPFIDKTPTSTLGPVNTAPSSIPGQLSSTYWSCAPVSVGNDKVILLESRSISTSGLHTCLNACDATGDTYGVLNGTLCLCGSVKSDTYNARPGCLLSCNTLEQSTCLPYIAFNEINVVGTYLASFNTIKSTIAADTVKQTALLSSSSFTTTSLASSLHGTKFSEDMTPSLFIEAPSMSNESQDKKLTPVVVSEKVTTLLDAMTSFSQKTSTVASTSFSHSVWQSSISKGILEKTKFEASSPAPILMTSAAVGPIVIPEVLSRVKRANSLSLGTSLSSTSNNQRVVLSGYGIQFDTTDEKKETNWNNISVYIVYMTENKKYSLLYRKINEALTINQTGIDIIDNNTVAFPSNTAVNISLVLHSIDDVDDLSASFLYDGHVSKLALSQCRTSENILCDSSKSLVSMMVINVTSEATKNISISIKGDDSLSASISLKFRSLNSVTAMPEYISPLVTYAPTSESVFFVFRTSFKLVNVLWTVSNSQRAIQYQNQSACFSNCPSGMPSSPSCLTTSSEVCFLYLNYIFQESDKYNVSARFSNPVTSSPLEMSISINTQAKIGLLSLISCDFLANVNKTKYFEVNFKGDNAIIIWYINGIEQRKGNNLVTFNYKFQTTGAHKISVFVYNKINNESITRGITCLPSGSLHGLSISQPISGSYHATGKPVDFHAKLCDGSDPKLKWSFDDGTSLDSNLSIASHTFTAPGEYRIQLKAKNFESKIEETALNIFLQDEIRNFTAAVSKTLVKVNEAFHIDVQISNGTSVIFTLKQGSKTKQAFNSCQSMNLTLPTAGIYWYTISAKNQVSNDEKSLYIEVQEPISISFKTVWYSPLEENNQYIGHRKTGNKLYCKWDFGDDSNTSWIFIDTAEPSINHIYKHEGTYTLQLFALNNISSANLSSIVFVQRRLDEEKNRFSVSGNSFVATGESMHISLSVDILSIFGYNISGATSFLLVNRSRQVTKTFFVAAKYELLFKASNQVSSVNKTLIVVAQDRIIGNVSISPPYVPVNATSQLTANSKGSDVIFNWTFSNGINAIGKTVTHYFPNLGVSLINIAAKNMISERTSNVQVNVEIPIKSLEIYLNASVIAVNSFVMVESSLPYRPEHVYKWAVDDKIINSTKHYFVWRFHTIGNHHILSKVENHIGNNSALARIEVQEPVFGVSLRIINSSFESIIVFNTTATIQAYVNSGSHLTYQWKSDYMGQVVNLHSWRLLVNNSDIFFVTVAVNVSNEISNVQEVQRFPVIYSLRNVRIMADSVHTSPNKYVRFSVAYSAGSNFTVSWLINGDFVANSMSIKYAFPAAGQYTVLANFSNEINSQHASLIITVQDLIQTVRLQPLFAATNIATEFTASVLQGTDVSFDWTIPSSLVSTTQSIIDSKQTLTFKEPGVYTFKLRTRNLVHNINSSFSVTAQDPIDGLEILHNSTFYPTLKDVYFQATIKNGSNATFFWLFSSITSHEYSNSGFTKHIFTYPGSVKISVNASNKISWISKSIIVHAVEVVQIISVEPSIAKALPTNEPIRLMVHSRGTNVTLDFTFSTKVVDLENVGNNVSFVLLHRGIFNVTVNARNIISSANRTFSYIVQEKITDLSLWVASLVLPVGSAAEFIASVRYGSDISYTWKINETAMQNIGVVLNRKFLSQGIFEVKVTASNGLPASASRSLIMKVEKAPCAPPHVTVVGSKRREIFKSQWLYSEASIDYNCSSSSLSSFWSFTVANIASNCETEHHQMQRFNFTDSSSEVNLDAPLLAIPPCTLPEGIFCMVYTAMYGDRKQYKMAYAVKLKVMSTPLIPIIGGGEIITVGTEQSFYLDASDTIDPDAKTGEPSDLLFKWTCKAKQINHSRVAISPGCQNISWINQSSIYVSAGSLDINAQYEISLFVKKSNGLPLSSTQIIKLVPGKVAEVVIDCITCKIYKSLQYVGNREMKFVGKCNNCNEFGPFKKLQFIWTLSLSNGTVVSYSTRNGTESSNIWIIKTYTLDGLNSYKLRLTITFHGDAVISGGSSLDLRPNPSPVNGSCNITPDNGTSLQTTFSYSCRDWQDEDNMNSPFIFSLIVVDSDLSREILYRGIQRTRSFYLPVGDPKHNRELQLEVLVEDIFGAATVGLRRSVMVYPPVVSNMASFLENNVVSSLHLLVEENDLNKVITAASSSAKLISEASKIGKQESDVISNITSSASKMSASSLENVDQLSNTLRFSMNLVTEQSVNHATRKQLTKSLQKMIAKIRNWAEQGQLGSASSLESLLFLTQNNIAAETLTGPDASSRNKRSIPEDTTTLKMNLNLAMELYTSVLRASLLGENPKHISTKYGSVILNRASSSNLARNLSADGCGFNIRNRISQHSDIYQIFNTSITNPYPNPSDLSSFVAGLSFTKPDGTEIPVRNLSSNESVLIKLNSTLSSTRGMLQKIVNPDSFLEGEMTVDMPVADISSLHVEIFNNSVELSSIDAYLRAEQMPKDGDKLHQLNSSNSGILATYFSPRQFNSSTRYFLRIRNRNKDKAANISVMISAVSCLFWNRLRQKWDSHGCSPSKESHFGSTVCHCNHLTSFASTFKIAPNAIKWSTLSKLDIEKNPIAIATCLALIVVYLICLFLASRKDDDDRRNAQFIPLIGADDFFKYEIRVKTGIFPGAGTTANVGIKIFGTKCTTKAVVLAKNDGLQRNSIDLFRFTSPTRLGSIHKINVWHDNSGSRPSWYLSRIVIKNLLSGEKFFFFCNSWLAVDRADGAIEREFFAADQRTMAKYSTIFHDVIGRTFSDYHLWLSVFEKPRLSRFTRVQRITCCLTFLLSWMCVDAMWFATVREGKIDLYLGLKGYSYEEVIVGIISSLMVFPINMVLVLLFRNSKLPKSRRILDGEEEVTIHVIPNGRRARRPSEDWIEIEDIRPAGNNKFSTSLPRCVGLLRLRSYHPLVALNESQRESLMDVDSDEENDDRHEIESEPQSRVKYVQRSTKNSIEQQQSEAVTDEQRIFSRMARRNTTSYTRISCEDDDEEAVEEEIHISSQPERIGTSPMSHHTSTSTLQTNLSRSTRNNSAAEATKRGQIFRAKFSSQPAKIFIDEKIIDISEDKKVTNVNKASNNNYESSNNQHIKYQDINDSFGSRKSSHPTSSSSTGASLEPFLRSPVSVPVTDHDHDMSRDIPDIREFHSNLDCLLPPWCIILAYFGCMSICILSFVVILIYGQQFGKEKAISWIKSLFSGLFQDIFITYPVLLVMVAATIALARKPMNLDYTDFVACPVVPGEPSVTAKPLRGYALEIAQKQGKNKRQLREILKNALFQFIHLWIIFSICITSYESNMSAVREDFVSRLDSGKSGISSVKSINQFWLWTEQSLPQLLYPDVHIKDNWVLRSVPRLHQIRVQDRVCRSYATISKETPKRCNGDYSARNEERRDFAGTWKTIGNSKNTPWSYRSEQQLNGSFYQGELSRYPYSGYVAYLGANRNDFTTHIQSLKSAMWLDVKTRALFMKFTMQNVNINKYVVVTIAFEINPTGFIIPKLEMLYTRIHMYTSRIDYFRLFCEVIFGLWTFYLLFQLKDCAGKHQWKFFHRIWNIHLVFLTATSAAVVALSIYRLVIYLKIQPHLKNGIPLGFDLRHEAIIDWAIQALLGFLCFLVILKTITLFSWMRAFVIFGGTMKAAFSEIFGCFIFLMMITIAFSSWAYFSFGADSYQFHSFGRSFVYTFLIRISGISSNGLSQNGNFVAWSILHTFIFFALVVSFFKVVIMASYQNGKLEYLLGQRKRNKDFIKYLYKIIQRKEKTKGKRVKFSLVTSARRSTLAASQQTISLASDSAIYGNVPAGFPRMPRYHKEKLLNRLNPRTDEILAYVHQLEEDDFLEEEFYSKLEEIATVNRGRYTYINEKQGEESLY